MVRLQHIKDSKPVAVAVALFAAVAFRLPELLNAGVVNSDSAIVGLQAMHILRGEWHWFLWGSGYQTTADAVVAAGLFAIFGASPASLMWTALAGHLLAIVLALLTLARRISPWAALALVSPLVLASAPTHTYTLHPPRQTAITLVFAAVFVLDGAARARRSKGWFALGSALATFACFADPYALVFIPGLSVLALMASFDVATTRKMQLLHLGAGLLGATVGAIPLGILRQLPQASGGPLTLTADLLKRNWSLFIGPCLQWVVGTRVLHQPASASDYQLWQPPVAFELVQWLGVAGLVTAIISSLALARSHQVPWELRRLSCFGNLTLLVTIAGFLLSVMPMDKYSSRYLVAIVLVVPFVFAPAVYRARPLAGACLLAPLVASFAVSGWLGYEPCVRGLRIVDAHWSQDELALKRELLLRQVRYAEADYWAAYRLTFMFQEAVKVVPIHPEQDRYSPYRDGFATAVKYAYIYDHRRSDESAETLRAHASADPLERFSVGNFDVYLQRRRVAKN